MISDQVVCNFWPSWSKNVGTSTDFNPFLVIGIDEGQFFPDVVEFADRVANLRKVVLVAGLDGTFERKNFNRILELIPMAEIVNKLKAVCMGCGEDAAFTKRLASDDKRIEVIGGAEKYMACCRKCYHSDYPGKYRFKRLKL